MSESYRGLTIRIGGDTTKLQKELKAANSAISQTDSELRKLKTATRLDPDSLKAYNLQLSYMEHQAENTAMRLAELERVREQFENGERLIVVDYEVNEDGTLEQVKETISEILSEQRKVDELLDGESVNVERVLGMANSKLAQLTSSLGSAHNELSDIADIAAMVAREKLYDAFKFAMMDPDDSASIDEFLSNVTTAINNLPGASKRTEEQVKEIVAEIQRFGEAIRSTVDFDTYEVDAEKLRKLLKDMASETYGIKFSDEAITDMTATYKAWAESSIEANRTVAAGTSELTGLQQEHADKVRDGTKAVDDLNAELDELVAEKERLEESVSSGKALIDTKATMEQVDELRQRIEDLSDVTDGGFFEQAAREDESELAEYRKFAEILEKQWRDSCVSTKKDLATVRDELANVMSEKDLSEIRGRINTLTQAWTDAKLSGNTGLAKQVHVELEAARKEEDDYTASVAAAQKKVDEIRSAGASKRTTLQNLQKIAWNNYYDMALGDALEYARKSDEVDMSTLESKQRNLDALVKAHEEANRQINSGLMDAQSSGDDDRYQQLIEMQKQVDKEYSDQKKSLEKDVAEYEKSLVEQVRTARLSARAEELEQEKLSGRTYKEILEERKQLEQEAIDLERQLENNGRDLTDDETAEKKARIAELAKEIAQKQKEIDSVTEDTNSELAKMESLMSQTQAELDKSVASAEELGRQLDGALRDATERAKGITGEVFSRANGNVDIEHIRNVLESVAADAGLSSHEINALIADIGRLSDEFVSADTNVKKWRKVMEFQDIVVEIEKGRASLTNFSKVLSDMSMPSELMRGMSDLTANSKVLEGAYSGLMSSGRTLSEAFKADPSNLNALGTAMNSYAAAAMVATENSQRLQSEMDRISAAGVNEIDGGMRSAQQALFDSAEAAEEARRKYENLKGQVDELVRKIEELNAKRTESITDRDMFASSNMDKNYLEMLETELEIIKELKSEAQRNSANADQALEVARRTAEYEKLRAKVAEYGKAVEDAYDAELKMAKDQSLFDSFGDTSEIDRLSAQITAAAERARVFDAAIKSGHGSTEVLTAKSQALSEAEKLAARQAELVNEAIANVPTERVDALRDRYGSLGEAVHATTEATKAYAMQLDAAKAELAKLVAESGFEEMSSDIYDVGKSLDVGIIGKLGDSANKVTELRGTILTLGDAFNQASVKMDEAAAAQFAESLQETVAKSTTAGTERAQDSSAAMQQAFNQLIQYAERAGQEIVESASVIDAAFRDVTKTVDGTEAQFEDLRSAAIQFSQTHAVSADTILEMESLGGQLGIAVDKLQEFGEVASNLDIATDIDAEDVALKLGQITNVMDDMKDAAGNELFENFADSLVRLGNNMAAQESNIIAVAQRMSSVANVANMTTPDLLAWSAAIASTGQRSESAATAISNTMTGIAEAVTAGGADLKGFASIAQMSAEEFAAAWMSDPTTALKAFIDGLQSMSDSNTEAIAALENMGITSVRQQNSLLALASTVDNLDDALTMSRDAFNGVSDQWGQAGDAAIEAEKKSKGFSGTLQILKNNATDLAASLGDSLVAPMQVLSKAIEGVTDLLNAIPGPIKAVLVSVTGLTAIGGTAAELIGKAADAFKTLQNSGTVAGSAIGMVADKLAVLIPSLAATEGATAMLATSLATGLVTGGIVLAVAAISTMVGALSDMAHEAEESNRAHRELADSSRHLMDAVSDAAPAEDDLAESIRNVRTSASDTIDALDELARRQEALADKIDNRKIELQADYDNLDKAKEAIDKYADSADRLTYGEQADLINAVKAANDAMGTNLEVVDAANGKIREQGENADLTAEKIDEMIESAKRAKEGEVVASNLNDQYEEILKTQKDLAEIEKQLEDARASDVKTVEKLTYASKEAMDADASHIATMNKSAQERSANAETIKQLEEQQRRYTDELEKQQKAYEESARKAHDLGVAELEAADAASQSMAQLLAQRAAFSEVFSGDDVGAFVAQLIHLGATTEDVASLTDYQLTEIAKAYDGSVDSIAKSLQRLGLDFSGTMDEIGRKAKEAASEVQKASQEEITAQQAAFTKEYNDRKRELDAAYDALKKDKDREYDALKRALDDEYDLLKDGYDREYELQKREYDKRYDALKDELDRQYDAYKKAKDSEYDALKKQLDAEYDAVKKGYDAQYNEVKSQLDGEYSLVKKQYDKRYNEIKKSLDAEYDQVKKQLDSQYNVRKKALDGEYDKLKDALDDQYDARKKALDREYKAAQKASQKYLKEFKKDQQAQVDAFKKATDARVAEINKELKAKEALIDSDAKRKTDDIDARIAALKGETEAEEKEEELRVRNEKIAELQKAVNAAQSRRTRAEAQEELSKYLKELALADAKEQREILIDQLEAEKDLIEENADNRKDQLDEQYDAEIEQYKEKRQLQLEALQESLDARYEMESEAEAARLEAIKERQQLELDAIKEANDQRLETLKERQQVELDSIKEAHDLQLEAIKEKQQERLDAVKEQHQLELDEIKEAQELQLQQVKDGNDLALQQLKENNELVLQTKKEENELELQALKDANDEQLQAQKLADQDELDYLKANHEELLKQKKYSNEDLLKAKKDELDGELDAQKTGDALTLEQLKADQTEYLNQMRYGTSTAAGYAKDAAEDIKDASNDMTGRVSDDAATLNSKVSNEFGGMNGKTVALFSNTKKSVTADSKATKDSVSSDAKATSDSVRGAVDSIDKKATGVSGNVKSKVSSDAEATKNKVGGITSALASTVERDASKIESSASTHSTNAKGKVEANWNDIGNKTKSTFTSAESQVSSSMDKIESTTKTKGDAAGKNVTAPFGTIPSAVMSGVEPLKQKLESHFNGYDSVGSKAASTITKSISDGLKPVYDNGKMVGGNLDVGLAQGMYDRQGEVWNAAVYIANLALNTIKSTMGINSPSKVTYRYGQYTAEGFESGILSGEGDVADAASTLAETLGSNFATDYGAGLKASYAIVEENATRLREVVSRALSEMGENAGQYGTDAGTKFTAGLKSSTGDAGEVAKRASAAMVETFEKTIGWAKSSGGEIGMNLVDGMRGSLPTLVQTAKQMANVVATYLHHSTPDKGPLSEDDTWGGDLVDNIAEGMREQEGRLYEIAVRLAELVSSGFTPSFDVGAAVEESAHQIQEAVDAMLTQVETTAQASGATLGDGYSAGMEESRPEVDAALKTLSDSAISSFRELGVWIGESGQEAGVNFTEGLRSSLPTVMSTSEQMANAVAMYLHHSTPDNGPLADDDRWGSDLVDNIVSGMREKSSLLQSQAELLAKIVSEGFNPDFALDSAVEAMRRLEEMQIQHQNRMLQQQKEFLQKQMEMQAEQMKSQERMLGMTGGVNVNVTLTDVTIRETADINLLAERLAQRVDQVSRSRLGR